MKRKGSELKNFIFLLSVRPINKKLNNATTTDPTCLILTNIYILNYRKEARI